uniref:SIN3-HDAC complex associated factor, like n=1 Tax=Cyprinus carpio TaxID=7962 RepID=A0A8C2CMN9_CYPCA
MRSTESINIILYNPIEIEVPKNQKFHLRFFFFFFFFFFLNGIIHFLTAIVRIIFYLFFPPKVVDARAGPGFKLTKPKKVKNSDGKKKSKLKKLHKFKRQNSDAHSTTSSMSPSQSPSHSNQSDDGSDIETKQRRPNPSGFSFLDLSYWKRKKVCCGIVYKGRFGEVIIDPRLFKPCCNKKRPALASSSDSQISQTLPSPLPEDMKEAW